MAMYASDLKPVETVPVKTSFRRIVTPIPVPESLEEIQRLRAVEPVSMAGMPPVLWDHADGFLIRDAYGNQWIDLSSGIVVANVGHAHPAILDSVRRQLEARLIFSYAFSTNIRRQLLERLVGLAPEGLGKAILFSAGTEATECAMSLMRKHGLTIAPGKIGILSIESSYHGRTLSARLAGGAPGLVDGIARKSAFHWQLPLPGGPDSQGFEEDLAARGIDANKLAGIIFESIPGWTTTLYPEAYVRKMMEWAAKHQVLVTADEVQTGMARTGRMFAFEHYGIRPDLITCGKGLSSSLPVSAVIGRQAIMDLAPAGEMSSTFGGNPVCVAATLASLDIIEREKLVQRSALLGREVAEALSAVASRYPHYIRMHNGSGLFYSVHLKNPDTGEPLTALCDEIVMSCVRSGVMLFLTGRGFFKIVPPLTIDREALFEALDVIGTVMEQVLN
jgi:4-aminobutyrate aminotransferase/diaminobutyrate-pyruvate transaminase/4-aminobutyrate aminotransferase/(S)-3-amino-2-methylpropionate transaminase